MSTNPSPVIAVRALTATGDVQYGNSAASFIYDIEAVTQIILTRIRLFEGEWWEDLSQGTPMFQSILGAPANPKSQAAIHLIIQQRILGTPYVTGILASTLMFNRDTRQFTFSCTVSTVFGTIVVTNVPQPSSGTAASAEI
jgi:hypothetical protein